MKNFGPVITEMVTPFDEYNQVDMTALRKLVLHLIASGSTSLALTCIAGEAPCLSITERIRIWETTVDFAGGTLPILAEIGTNCTKTTLANVKIAEEMGVDGLLVTVPFYNCPNQAGLLNHFKAVARSTSLPIMIQDAPERTGATLQLGTLAELLEEKNIVGLSRTGLDRESITKLKLLAPKSFCIYGREDGSYLDTLKWGADGIISAAPHIIGDKMLQTFELLQAGAVQEVEKLDARLQPVYQALAASPSPISIKALMNEAGLVAGDLRSPLMALDQFESRLLYESVRGLLQ